jgi:hypothetical protein
MLNTYYRCFVLFLMILSKYAHSDTFHYRFHWLRVPVADLSIEYHADSLIRNITNANKIKFKINTIGPLKIFRNYHTEGYIDKNRNEGTWDYYITGVDRGQPEEKLITYSQSSEPIIKIFVDDEGEEALNVDPQIDRSAIDPFMVLISTINELTESEDCTNKYHVMDGKRRYLVKSVLINNKTNSIDTSHILHCKIIVLNEQKNPSKERKKIWPFDGKDKVVNLWFDSELDYMPVKIESATPLGFISGKLLIR